MRALLLPILLLVLLPQAPALERSASVFLAPAREVAAERFAVGAPHRVTVLPAGSRWSGRVPIRLAGRVVVASGDTLRIEAGARVAAEPGTELVVSPGAVLLAAGTATRPIDLGCVGSTGPGCWAGVTIQGETVLEPDGTSGTLRYVRVRGGRLRLENVGAGTVIDGLQVDRAAADGLELVGGTVRLQRVYLTRNPGYGLAWSGGWSGSAQRVAVVADPDGFQGGIRGSGDVGASGPTLLNVTVVTAPSPAHPAPDAPALRLDGGARGSLRNLLLVQPGVALDVDGADTCANLVSGALVLDHVLVGGAELLGSPDPDPIPCGPWPSPSAEQALLRDTSRANVFLTEPPEAGALLAMSGGTDALVDLRPLAARSDTLSPFHPPDDGFFDPDAAFFGAVEGIGLPGGTLPWTAGWALPLVLTLPTPSVPAFDLDIRPTGPMEARLFRAFLDAEHRWESMLSADVPDVAVDLAPELCLDGSPALRESVDDLVVLAAVDSIDGPGGVVGQAGPCVVRTESSLPLVGLLRLDEADVSSLESAGVLEDLILHELAHALGFGTVWTRLGLLAGGGTADPTFVGPGAVSEYQALGGTDPAVPVEATGGPGTRDAHWRESVFGDELMTGFLSLAGNPLSALTIRSLGDLGYAVDPSAADAFGVPAPVRVAPPGGQVEIRELLVRPRWVR